MLVLAREVHDLHHLGLGHLVGKDAAFTDTMLMNVHHDSLGGVVVLMEEALQHLHDKLHRSVTVVQKQHAVEVGAIGLRLGFGDDRSARGSRPWLFALVLTHQHDGSDV